MPLTGAMAVTVASMAALLDVRSAFRLPIVFAGAMLAGGRRTASRWFRAAGVGDDWDRFYDLFPAIGKKGGSLGAVLLRVLVQRFDPGPDGYWKIAIDDSPTKRFGPHVEAANVHHPLWSNIGCWNLCTWLYTLVELECWDEVPEDLVDRSDRPWDNPDRRPSHADRRRRIARKMLENELLNDMPPGLEHSKFRHGIENLLSLAT